MTKFTTSAVALLAGGILATQSAHGAARTWGNTGTDYNAAASWNAGAGPAPGTGDVGLFTAAEVTQPNLSASLSNSGLFFNGAAVNGYDVTGSAGASLTLTGNSTSGSSGTSDSSAAAIRSNATSGTNTIDVPLILAPTTTSTFFNTAGGTLVVNSAISESAAGKALSLKNGTIQLNGANSFSGGASIDAATTLVIGNDSALGTGTFSINSTSTIQPGGGARTISNNVVLGGNTTVSGSNALTVNGTFTSSGSNTRTLTVDNTGGLTLGGNVFLQEAAATGRTLTINGSSAVQINGTVADGGTGPATLKYTGSSTLTLNHANNTYSGGTQETISGSTIVANKDGALGTGNVSLTTASVTLTLQGGTTNNYIADFANLSLLSTDTVNLNFNGTDTIGQLLIGNVSQASGTYGAVGSGATNQLPEFTGTGILNVTGVPEPATWMLMGVGLLFGAQRFRRKV